jgi:putative oxidoreductase
MLGRHSERTYALLRIVVGILFACHGAQKLLGIPFPVSPDHGGPPPVGSFHWIGGLVELVCGVTIALGLFARLFAFLASGEMAVAYFGFHWKPHEGGDLFAAQRFWPLGNGGELAVVYCFLFLYMACKGSGIWSIDSARRHPAYLP